MTKEERVTNTITKSARITNKSFLLKEDAFYLLLETGSKIILSLGFIQEARNLNSLTKTARP